MPGTVLPPFPDDVPTVPLVVVDYALMKAGDAAEIDGLWKAATELGFWYLKNHGADEEVDAMFEMGAETMALSLEEKMLFEQGDSGVSFGYKYAGSSAVDQHGTPDACEFINVARDDALAWPTPARRTYPATVNARMESAVRPFTLKSIEIAYVCFGIFDQKLGLPDGTLARLHPLDEHSGSESRCIKVPGNLPYSADKATLGSHTDFGSLSFLHNRLGGLQVFPPGVEEWKYVKPLPGHAICNIGDALTVFSGGILRSNVHRVVDSICRPPPKAQAAYERWSLVHFTRPGQSIMMQPLEQSPMVAESVAKAPGGKYNTGVNAGAWFARRIQYQRLANRKGPESWMASRGTEHKEIY
ncbi:Clavaminate synthase-like protein [Auriscalpium vulgare]|uniref:Clavaminate synthase-like protein n=1 Tax=Auriscalpium vulgare TaxID=40419 RepID=A0ACB8RZE7_9AGAM|nr:Clavaminate synthase-like protein [Auriscalpium vulgare]